MSRIPDFSGKARSHAVIAAARAVCVALASTLVIAGCAGLGWSAVKVGDRADDVRQRLGAPTAEHVLPGGVRRLEYSGGAFGKFTLMIDTDAQGQVLRAENVRDEVHFDAIRAGITHDELRQRLGSPSRVWGVRYHDQTVWSYRFESPFCRIFNVGITPDGIVEDTSYGPDPVCEDIGRVGGLRLH